MINALRSRDDPLRSLKTAIVSDLAAARHAIDGYEMARAGEGLRRLAGILDMAMLPMAQRFCDEIAELTLAAAAGAAGIPRRFGGSQSARSARCAITWTVSATAPARTPCGSCRSWARWPRRAVYPR